MWIHLPYSVSTPVVEDSTSDSEWLFPMLEQFVTWRGMLRPSKSWSRTCKKEGWMKPRSGLIPGPSTASRGVEQWIGSLVASRASRGQSQERSEEPMMNAGSGPTSDASLAKWNPEDCSWRTSQASFWEEYSPYLETWPRTGMTRSGQLFGLPTLVRRTDESDVSSWPTAVASLNSNRTTQRAPSHNDGTHGENLAGEASIWRTPDTALASMYAENRDMRMARGRERATLATQADDAWATPTGRDHKDGANPSENVATNSLLGRQAPRTPMPGKESSKQPRRLNPRFVEMLMGWPLGWTDFVSSGTASSPSKPPSPSASSVRDSEKLNSDNA